MRSSASGSRHGAPLAILAVLITSALPVPPMAASAGAAPAWDVEGTAWDARPSARLGRDAGAPMGGTSSADPPARLPAILAEPWEIADPPTSLGGDPPVPPLLPPPAEPSGDEASPPHRDLEDVLAAIPREAPLPQAVPAPLAVATGEYVVCGGGAGAQPRCSPNGVPMGTPVPFDLDGDAGTGVAGNDVLVLAARAVNPDAVPAGFSALLSVVRLEPDYPLGSRPLPAQVFVVLGLPSGIRVIAGFDGTTGTLADAHDALVTLRSLPAALGEDVRMFAKGSLGGPSGRVGLLLGHARTEGEAPSAATVESTLASLKLDPSPREARLAFRFRSEDSVSLLDFDVETPEPAQASVGVSLDHAGARSALVAVVDHVPGSLDVELQVREEGTVGATLSSSEPLERVQLRSATTPRAGSAAARSTLDAAVAGAPASVSWTFGLHPALIYAASARAASASVAIERFDANGRTGAFASHVVDAPAEFSVEADHEALAVSVTTGAPLGAITATAYDRETLASATVSATGVPGGFLMEAAGGRVRVFSESAIGQLSATLLRRGGSAPSLAGNHLSAAYSQRATSDLDLIGVRLRLPQVTRVEMEATANGTSLDLREGGGAGALNLRSDAWFVNGDRSHLDAQLSALPGSLQLTIGETITVEASARFDLTAIAQHGAGAGIAAAPATGGHHGLSMRDGAVDGARGIRTWVHLTGISSEVTLNARENSYALTGWRPTLSQLTFDVKLDDDVAPPLVGHVVLSSVPGSLSLTYHMTTEDSGGLKRVRADLTTSAPLGQLRADATVGTHHGRLVASRVPGDLHASYTNENGRSTLDWETTGPVASLFAGSRLTTLSRTFQASASLTDLPARFTLALGRDPAGSGPTFDYSASASTLDGTAQVDPGLWGGDPRARLSFGVTDLGAQASASAAASGLRFASEPETAALTASAWARLVASVAGSGTWSEDELVEVPWTLRFEVEAEIAELRIAVTKLTQFSLSWGAASRFSGAYGTFTAKASGVSASLDAEGSLDLLVDWPEPLGSSRIPLVDARERLTGARDVLFHKSTGHEGPWLSASGHSICDWTLTGAIGPHPHGTEWNGIEIASASSEGGAWYAVPNPAGAVPAWLVDLVARHASTEAGAGPTFQFGHAC